MIRSLTAPNPGPFTLDGTRSYLLGERAVIDPGPAIEEHVRAILEVVPGLTEIFVTHRHADHAPAAVRLQQETGARIIAPRGVLDDEVIGERVSGGERFQLDDLVLEVIATPGHTAEHVCYFTGDGDLFTGDTILGAGTTAVLPPDGDMTRYVRSLHLLRSLSPRRIYPGHGPTRDDAVDLIDEYIAHRRHREQEVLDALASGARSISEMRSRIYPGLDERLIRAAEGQLTAHLVKLRDEGRIDENVLSALRTEC